MRVHYFVVDDEGNSLAVGLVYILDDRRRLERAAEFECLGGVEQFDCKHTLRVEYYLVQFYCCIGTHADMVFLSLA